MKFFYLSSVTVIILYFTGCSSATVGDGSIAKCDIVLDKGYYEICYDYGYKGALFVSYHLDGKKVYETNIEERDTFYIEPSLPREYASSSEDYVGSGYDRGHLASDASFDYSQDALHSVYTLANIVPQNPDVNREEWIDTEYYERQKAKEFGSVDVIIGVEYSDNPMRLGEDGIAVPSGFYKSIQNIQKNFHECYFYENIPSFEETLQDHQVRCEDLVLEYD